MADFLLQIGHELSYCTSYTSATQTLTPYSCRTTRNILRASEININQIKEHKNAQKKARARGAGGVPGFPRPSAVENLPRVGSYCTGERQILAVRSTSSGLEPAVIATRTPTPVAPGGQSYSSGNKRCIQIRTDAKRSCSNVCLFFFLHSTISYAYQRRWSSSETRVSWYGMRVALRVF